MKAKDLFLERTFIAGNYLVLCTKEEYFHKFLDYIEVPKDDRPIWVGDGANATTHTIDVNGNTFCAVCIKPVPNHISGIEIAGMLVHEAVHVWQNKMADIGEHNPSKEFEAYSIQAISQTLMQAYVEQARHL